MPGRAVMSRATPRLALHAARAGAALRGGSTDTPLPFLLGGRTLADAVLGSDPVPQPCQSTGRHDNRGKEKTRKEQHNYTFWHLFNEKPGIHRAAQHDNSTVAGHLHALPSRYELDRWPRFSQLSSLDRWQNCGRCCPASESCFQRKQVQPHMALSMSWQDKSNAADAMLLLQCYSCNALDALL